MCGVENVALALHYEPRPSKVPGFLDHAGKQASQTQGGELDEARSELGPKVAKITGSSPYRYAQWGYR